MNDDDLDRGNDHDVAAGPLRSSANTSDADMVIVGASVRAAAASARRAGLAPLAIDRFGDVDLCDASPTYIASRYPEELAELLACVVTSANHALPWMYTGALECHPVLIERLAELAPLWGNAADVVRRVRDPWMLQQTFSRAGVASPAVRALDSSPSINGPWLLKSPHSSGGTGVHCWPLADRHTPPPGAYLQQYVAGTPCSAIFVAAAGQCRMLGASRQLIGAAWAGSSGFRYVGSLASRPQADTTAAQFQVIGDTLVSQFDLVGLFGVDAIVTANDTTGTKIVWPIEVNPRYTASVETIERLTGLRAIDAHVRACRDGKLSDSIDVPKKTPKTSKTSPESVACVGKAIMFAPGDVVTTRALSARIERLNAISADTSAGWPAVADIPHVGTPIPRGAPVLTVLAHAGDVTSVEKQLRAMTAELASLLAVDASATDTSATDTSASDTSATEAMSKNAPAPDA
ncbi:MAG: ATP-grasp domain-containing protein [Pirellulales bacterium]